MKTQHAGDDSMLGCEDQMALEENPQMKFVPYDFSHHENDIKVKS